VSTSCPSIRHLDASSAPPVRLRRRESQTPAPGAGRRSGPARGPALGLARNLVLVLAIAALAACAGQQQPSPVDPASASLPKNAVPPAGTLPQADAVVPLRPPPDDNRIRVGFLAPLSGPQGAMGHALLNAAQLALFDQPRSRLVLVPRDTEGTAEGAAAAASAAVAEGAALLVGPLFAESTRAAAPVAQARGVNIISFSSNREVAGGGVYILGFTPGEQAERIVRHAADIGLNRLALLAPDNPYGATVIQAAERAAGQRGLPLVRVERYRPDTQDFAAAIGMLVPSDGAVARPDFDALLIAEGGDRLRLIVRQLPRSGVDLTEIRLLGTGLWDDPAMQREAGLLGGRFATASPDLAASFEQRYREAYGEAPPRIAVLAYDAVALAAALAQRPATGQGDRFSRLALEDPEGFVGYGGIFRLSPNGTAERGLAVLEVTSNGFTVAEPPPERFTPPAGF